MKKILLLIILLWANKTSGQNSFSEYYPLEIGNKWFYLGEIYEWEAPDSIFWTKEVIGDTLMPNDYRYFIINDNGNIRYERYDSTTNTVRYYQYNGWNNCGIDMHMFSFSHSIDSTVLWNRCDGGYYYITYNNAQTDSVMTLTNFTEKSYSNYWGESPFLFMKMPSMLHEERIYEKGIGLTYYFQGSGGVPYNYLLNGAIINGDTLGLIPCSENEKINANEFYPLAIGNKWFYEDEHYALGIEKTVRFKEVVGDTIMDNGLEYYIVSDRGYISYQRVDTLMNSIMYYKDSGQGGKICQDDNQAYSLDYNHDYSTSWYQCDEIPFKIESYEPNNLSIDIVQNAKIINYTNYWGKNECILIDMDYLIHETVVFEKGLGETYHLVSEGGMYTSLLKGAIINGDTLGTILKKDKEKITAKFRKNQVDDLAIQLDSEAVLISIESLNAQVFGKAEGWKYVYSAPNLKKELFYGVYIDTTIFLGEKEMRFGNGRLAEEFIDSDVAADSILKNGAHKFIEWFPACSRNYYLSSPVAPPFKTLWQGKFVHKDSTLIIKIDAVSGKLVTDVKENETNKNVPSQYSLSQNYPNPFNPSTTIEYTIPVGDANVASKEMKIAVYNILGKKIKTLYSGTAKPGYHKIKIDGTNLPSGTYFVQMVCGDYRKTIKALLVK